MKTGELPKTTPIIVVAAVIAGYALVYALNYLIDRHANREVKHIDKNHPSTADNLDELIHADHFESHKGMQNPTKSNLFLAGLVMMIAIALHNLPEGMVIGASYAMEDDLMSNIFSGSGFIMAIVIGLHNIPEGMAVSVPLISGGMGKWKAVGLTALSGLPTVIGALLAMLYVVFGELLPESILMWKSKLPSLSLFAGVLVGFLLVSY